MKDFLSSILLICGWFLLFLFIFTSFASLGWATGFLFAAAFLAAGTGCILLSKKLDKE